jgi:hypothetical protein
VSAGLGCWYFGICGATELVRQLVGAWRVGEWVASG